MIIVIVILIIIIMIVMLIIIMITIIHDQWSVMMLTLKGGNQVKNEIIFI